MNILDIHTHVLPQESGLALVCIGCGPVPDGALGQGHWFSAGLHPWDVTEDFDRVMEIYRIAQDFMISTGNPNQWKHSHPAAELVKEDIEKSICHVICDGDTIHGVFAMLEGKDPTYSYIEGGKWLNDDKYVTIHRIAGDGQTHGILETAVEYGKKYADNIRMDTHNDNLVMQGALGKQGFKRCGIIYLENGDPRIAFQLCK